VRELGAWRGRAALLPQHPHAHRAHASRRRRSAQGRSRRQSHTRIHAPQPLARAVRPPHSGRPAAPTPAGRGSSHTAPSSRRRVPLSSTRALSSCTRSVRPQMSCAPRSLRLRVAWTTARTQETAISLCPCQTRAETSPHSSSTRGSRGTCRRRIAASAARSWIDETSEERECYRQATSTRRSANVTAMTRHGSNQGITRVHVLPKDPVSYAQEWPQV
jgi:hypothetical protein